MSLILHLTPAWHYDSLPPGAPYRSVDFEREGFIHCTQGADTLLRVANRFYRDASGDFVALVVDDGRLSAPIKWEPGALGGESLLFPHIYGPIDRAAIVGVVPVRRDFNGEFVGLEGPLDDWESSP
jgi:hypothetical protein